MFNQTYQPPSTLPVSAQHVDQSTFVNGLPYQCPFVPNIPCEPQQQQLLLLAAGYYRKALQDSAGKNAARIFSYNLNSLNQFQNDTYAQNVFGVLEYAECLIMTQGQPPEQAVANAAQELAGIMTAVYVQQYPELAHITFQQNPQGQQDVQRLLGTWQQIQGAVQNYKMMKQQQVQQQQFQPQGFGQMPQRQMGNFNTIQPMGGVVQQPYGMHAQPTFGIHGAQRVNHGAMAAATPQVAPQSRMAPTATVTTTRGGLQPRKPRSGIVEEFGEDAQGQAVVERNPQYKGYHSAPDALAGKVARNTPIAQAHVPAPAPAPTQAPVEQQYTHITDTGIGIVQKDPLRPYDEIVLDNGVVLRPALTSEWTRTFSLARPYAELYNPRTHVKFHARTPSGEVYEVIQEMKEAMEYINHEIINRPRLAEQLAADGPKVGSHWELVERMENLPEVPTEGEATDVLTVSTDPLIFPDVLRAHSFAEAEILFHAYMAERGMDLVPKQPTEYYYNLVAPIFTQTPHLPFLRRLSNCTSLTQLADTLKEQLANTNSTYWLEVNRRVASHLNRVLEINMQLVGWGITNFAEGYADLCKMLTTDYSDRLVEILERHARSIIQGALGALSGDSLSEYFDRFPTKAGVDYSGLLTGTLVMSESVSVTTVPWTLSEFDADLTEAPALVKASTMPEFQAALAALVARTPNFSHRYLLTSDREVVEVSEGYLDSNAYLVRCVQVN